MVMTQEEFGRLYRDYVDQAIKPTEKATKRILKEWRKEGYWSKYITDASVASPRPIHDACTRIKRPESLLDKFKRLREEFPDGPTEDSLPLMRDFLGARVITYSLSHVRLVDQEIRSNLHFELSDEYMPRAYMSREMLVQIGVDPSHFELKGTKPSGYSSLHYFVRVKRKKPRERLPWFELQVRTMLEDAWGEIEHQLGYKIGQNTEFSVARQFWVISQHLQALDYHFAFLYDRLRYLQSISRPQPADSLNAENLPAVLHSLECPCEQRDIDGILRILSAYGIDSVGDLEKRARHQVVDAIRHEFMIAKPDEQVKPFHIVAALAMVSGTVTPEKARRQLRANLEMVSLTEWSRTEQDAEEPGRAVKQGDDSSQPQTRRR